MVFGVRFLDAGLQPLITQAANDVPLPEKQSLAARKRCNYEIRKKPPESFQVRGNRMFCSIMLRTNSANG
jgi:hypothetical protein